MACYLVPSRPMATESDNRPETATPLRQVLAESVRWHRQTQELTQKDLAAMMQALGFTWTPHTVHKVEANQRTLAADELVGLALVLQTPLADLLLGAPADVLVGQTPFDPVWVINWIVQSEDTFRLGDHRDLEGLSPAVQAMHGEVDPRLRAWVQQEMERWAEGRRLLRQPVTAAGLRQHRSVLWLQLAVGEQAVLDALGQLDEDTSPQVPLVTQHRTIGRVES